LKSLNPSNQKKLNYSLNTLIHLVTNEQKFTFTPKELNFNYESLIENEILHLESKKYRILNSSLFTLALFDYFSTKFAFKLTKNFTLNIGFLDLTFRSFKK
jgi:hypothetical protein